MEPTYQDWKTFEMRDRFTDPKYNQLPKRDLKKIKPLTREYFEYIYNIFISPEYRGWHKITRDSILGDRFNPPIIPAFEGEFKKKKKDRTRMILKYLVNLHKDTSIIFIWFKHCAVETTWGTFLKYWQDFCGYGFSETIILFPNDKALKFIDEANAFFLVDRVREFGKPNFDNV